MVDDAISTASKMSGDRDMVLTLLELYADEMKKLLMAKVTYNVPIQRLNLLIV